MADESGKLFSTWARRKKGLGPRRNRCIIPPLDSKTESRMTSSTCLAWARRFRRCEDVISSLGPSQTKRKNWFWRTSSPFIRRNYESFKTRHTGRADFTDSLCCAAAGTKPSQPGNFCGSTQLRRRRRCGILPQKPESARCCIRRIQRRVRSLPVSIRTLLVNIRRSRCGAPNRLQRSIGRSV